METCGKCGVLGHYKNFCKGGPKEARAKSGGREKSGGKVTAVTAESKETKEPEAGVSDTGEQSGGLGTLTGSWLKISGGPSSGSIGVLSNSGVKMPHKELSPEGTWVSRNVEPHGRLELSLRVCEPAYKQLGLRVPTRPRAVCVSGMADTGAQMCVGDVEIAERLGIKPEFMVDAAMAVTVANNGSLWVLGAGFVEIVSGSGRSSKQMVYFARGVGDFYLSKAACRELGVIGEQFPGPREEDAALCPLTGSSESRNLGGPSPDLGRSQLLSVKQPLMDSSPNVPVLGEVTTPVQCEDVGPDWGVEDLKVQGAGAPQVQQVRQQQPQQVRPRVDDKGRELAECGCLKRTRPPRVPVAPPFEMVPENVGKVEQWFREEYASSSFNNCPHQPLPLMSGLPPLRILMKPGVEPKVVHRPATVPVHWMDQVRQDLERDIALGVLERVPQNTPTTWCSRMHVVGKKTGEPRRVVDLRALNEATVRQTHYTEPPFSQAMGVEPHTWRFTSDAWNGYHSVPLDERDRHATTFITPWGRLRYRVAPQGSLTSGDGFTFWYDAVIRHLLRKRKCVDDVIGWAKTLLQLFYDTAEFLTLTGDHGIVQNVKKFVWGRREIEYVGFWLAEDGVKPSKETLSAIQEFPRPKDITGIRSWYGLVEQVSFAFSKSQLMEPFRDLLKKKSEFVWTQALQDAFDRAKVEIVELVKQGVKSFKLGAWTCVVTDWSRRGIGYVLWQKRCACSKIHPTCCAGGWEMVLCGARFCTPAESRYHPIEGELLGVAWALEKTRQYTLGCEKLLILVDHKPLVGLLTSRELGDIENPRLEHLAERLLRWSFRIEHVAGARNFGPDALSRYPGPEGRLGALGVVVDQDMEWSGTVEGQVLAMASSPGGMVSWEAVRAAGVAEKEYAGLLFALGHDGQDAMWSSELKDYAKYKVDLTTVDGVVLYRGRVVVPKGLRQEVLAALHRAHQGTTGMGLRAQESVWWPGWSDDVKRVREGCVSCTRSAPSQPALPPVSPPSPEYPFQMVSSDYFAHGGHTYLVLVDRYSGWPVVRRCREETAVELVTALRDYFGVYGTPEEIATDGASVYVSATVQRFLEAWSVRHRVSSAYNPHSNLRAETAVKTIKRLIRDNTGVRGSLDTDKMTMALLAYRNTPDRDTLRSPAQVLFARQLRDAVPVEPGKLRLRPEWVLTMEAREKALAKRHVVKGQQWAEHTKALGPLEVGCCVQVQNQAGPHKDKWDVSGTVTEVLPYDAYMIKMDGSGRVSKRNRRYLRPIVPYGSLVSTPDARKDTHLAGGANKNIKDTHVAGRADKTVKDTHIAGRADKTVLGDNKGDDFMTNSHYIVPGGAGSDAVGARGGAVVPGHAGLVPAMVEAASDTWSSTGARPRTNTRLVAGSCGRSSVSLDSLPPTDCSARDGSGGRHQGDTGHTTVQLYGRQDLKTSDVTQARTNEKTAGRDRTNQESTGSSYEFSLAEDRPLVSTKERTKLVSTKERTKRVRFPPDRLKVTLGGGQSYV